MKNLPWDFKISKIFYVLLIFVGLMLASTQVVLAKRASCQPFSYTPSPLYNSSQSVTFSMGPAIDSNKTYLIEVQCPRKDLTNARSPAQKPSGGTVTYEFPNRGGAACIFSLGARNVSLWKIGEDAPECTSTYTVGTNCALSVQPSSIDTSTQITISGTDVPSNTNQLCVQGPSKKCWSIGVQGNNFTKQIGNLSSAGQYTISLSELAGTDLRVISCAAPPIIVGLAGKPEEQPEPGELGELEPATGPVPCDPETGQIFNPKYQPEESKNARGISTALGCIPTKDTNEFAAWFLKWAIGIAGGIAFLLIVVSSFQIMTAAGNPERLQGGRELLTAAISGLILIIFSVFLLQLIGVEILKIPGFG